MAYQSQQPLFGTPTTFAGTGSVNYQSPSALLGADITAQPTLGQDQINSSLLDQLSGVTNFEPSGNLLPLSMNLPDATKQYNQKYAPGNPFENQLPTNIYNSLQDLDAQRLNKGQAPLSNAQSIDIAKSASTQQEVTPQPDNGNLITNALGDVGQIISSLPQLPGNLLSEAQQLPNIGNAIGNANGDLSKILQAPGIRLIPGTYTASNLLQGKEGVENLLKHPVFTGLDVLPYAEGLAKATPAFQSARDAAEEQARVLTNNTGTVFTPQEPNPIWTALTKRAAPEAAAGVESNIIGAPFTAAKDILGQTKIGQTFNDMFSTNARRAMQLMNAENMNISRGTTPGAEAINAFDKEIDDAASKYSDIPEERRNELDNMAINPVDKDGNPIQPKLYSPDSPLKPFLRVADITDDPHELAYLYDAKDITERFAQWKVANDDLQSINVNGQSEIYDNATAAKINKYQAAYDQYYRKFNQKQSLQQTKSAILDPDNPISINVRTTDYNPTGSADTSVLHNTVDTLKQYRRTEPQAQAFLTSFTGGDYGTAAGKLRQMANTGKWADIIPDAMHGADVLNELSKTDQRITAVGRVSERNLLRREDLVNRTIAASPPARFGPAVEEAFRNELRNYVVGNFATDPKLDGFLRYVDEGNYASLVNNSDMAEQDFYNLRRDVQKSWMDMREAGLDPLYLHRVAPDVAERDIANNRIAAGPVTPSSTKARTLDTAPYTKDIFVALKHDAQEFINQRATENFFDNLAGGFGTREADLRDTQVEMARRMNAINPGGDVNYFIDREMKRSGYSPVDPSKYMPWKGKNRTVVASGDRIWVPTEIVNNLDRIFSPTPKLVQALDPVMKLYRTSILALSPRFLAHSILGGAVMALGQAGVKWLKFLPEARDMLQEAGQFEERTGLPGHGFIGFPDDFKNWGSELSTTERIARMHDVAAGQWLSKIWESDATQKAAAVGGKVTNLAYKVASYAHDMYRAAAYLTGEDSALTKGLTQEEAHVQGIALARKIFNNWDETTPLERSIMRTVLPFYGWMKTLTSYVYHYPFDHPVRTSILGSFARNEIADRGTGLPDDLMNMLFVGSQDDKGNITGINARVLNPFASVQNYFTLAGIASESNPLIQGALKTMGVDLSNGGTNLYPNVTYNPDTGRLEGSGGNFFTNEAESVLPFIGTLNDVVLDNKQFARLLQTDPDAAHRQLLMQLGIPSALPNQINMPQEYMKAELRRETAADDEFQKAKSSGDYRQFLADYPGFAPLVAQIQQQQQAGKLDKFVPKLQPVG